MRERRTPFRLTDREVQHLDQLASSLGGRRRYGGVQKAIEDYARLAEDVRKGYWGNANEWGLLHWETRSSKFPVLTGRVRPPRASRL